MWRLVKARIVQVYLLDWRTTFFGYENSKNDLTFVVTRPELLVKNGGGGGGMNLLGISYSLLLEYLSRQLLHFIFILQEYNLVVE